MVTLCLLETLNKRLGFLQMVSYIITGKKQAPSQDVLSIFRYHAHNCYLHFQAHSLVLYTLHFIVFNLFLPLPSDSPLCCQEQLLINK